MPERARQLHGLYLRNVTPSVAILHVVSLVISNTNNRLMHKCNAFTSMMSQCGCYSQKRYFCWKGSSHLTVVSATPEYSVKHSKSSSITHSYCTFVHLTLKALHDLVRHASLDVKAAYLSCAGERPELCVPMPGILFVSGLTVDADGFHHSTPCLLYPAQAAHMQTASYHMHTAL